MLELIEIATLTGLIEQHDKSASELREKRAQLALKLYKENPDVAYADFSDAMNMQPIGVYKLLVKANGGKLTAR
jgi:hypothetical protein